MRTFIFLVGFIMLASDSRASLQTVRISPATLTGWTVVGVSQDALNKSPELSLPPNAQLSNTFNSSILAVSFTTQPVIGKESDTWPVLEVGSAALLFSRDSSGGHLMLVLGDTSPVVLPGSFQLDSDGRSVEPQAVSVSKVGAILKIDAFGKSSEFPAENSATTTLVISSGNAAVWGLNNFDVTSDAEAFSPTAKGGDQTGPTNNLSSAQKTRGESNGSLMVATGDGTSGDPTPTKDSTAKSKTLSPAKPLEVFTPPAVRLGRAGNVRAAAMEIQRK